MSQLEGAEVSMQPREWKRYPYALVPGDPEMVFPAAEGDQGAESNTYYVAGRLVGRKSGRERAFLTVFTFNNVRRRLQADFYALALFDLATGEYGTYSEFDFPRPLRIRRRYKLSVARGGLDVSFDSAEGRSSWKTTRPFDYRVSLVGRDQMGRKMRLELDLETRKPPLPVGGGEYRGIKTCIGQYGTHSYFLSDVRFAGTLEWGDLREEVSGDSGWIDRQWTPLHLGVHNDRRGTRYRHEWRQIHLDGGVEMSVWLQVDRRRGNRVIPFSGVTAAWPDGSVRATTEFAIERLSFVRDPGRVAPLRRLARGASYFTDSYRLRVPAWNLDLVSEPLVPAPAHRFPIEYWSGPTRIGGTLAGQPARGFGFHERTLAFCRDFELVEVLRETLRHLSPEALPAGSPEPLAAANLVWEIDAFLSHRDRRGALAHLRERARPELVRLGSEHVLAIADDLARTLRGSR